MCKDISTLHNGTGKTISLGIATGIFTDTFRNKQQPRKPDIKREQSVA
jgi:hypothetical protein